MSNSINKQILIFKWFNRLGIAFLISTIVLILYWSFEPDPLKVTYVDLHLNPNKTIEWSSCENRIYRFHRHVQASKSLDITVQERFISLDFPEYYGKSHQHVIAATLKYQTPAGTDMIMSFVKEVPDVIPFGLYDYVPMATYQVNPIKTIIRELPRQRVEVICD